MSEGKAMTARVGHLEWARAWLRQLLADRKQAQSESTARSLASQFLRAERDGAADAYERAAREVESILADEPGSAIPEIPRLIRALAARPGEGEGT
jgi:hypothetical protein